MPLKDLLFGFKGRIRRRDWWLWGIGVGLAWAVATTAVGGALFGMSWTTSLLGGSGYPVGWPITAYGLVTYAPLLWVQSALAAKRTHDRNKGAGVAVVLTILAGLLSFVIEIADLTLGAVLTDDQFGLLYGSVTFATLGVQLYLLVVLGFLDGTRGPNRFGRSPKGVGGDLPDQTAKVFS